MWIKYQKSNILDRKALFFGSQIMILLHTDKILTKLECSVSRCFSTEVNDCCWWIDTRTSKTKTSCNTNYNTVVVKNNMFCITLSQDWFTSPRFNILSRPWIQKTTPPGANSEICNWTELLKAQMTWTLQLFTSSAPSSN